MRVKSQKLHVLADNWKTHTNLLKPLASNYKRYEYNFSRRMRNTVQLCVCLFQH